MPSPLLSSLTNLKTRNKRKNVMDTFPLSPLPPPQSKKKRRYLHTKKSKCVTILAHIVSRSITPTMTYLELQCCVQLSPHHDRLLPGSIFFPISNNRQGCHARGKRSRRNMIRHQATVIVFLFFILATGLSSVFILSIRFTALYTT